MGLLLRLLFKILFPIQLSLANQCVNKTEQMACFSPAVEFPGFLHPGADKDYSINPKLSIAVARNCISIGNSIALIEKRDRSFTCSSILRHA